MFAVYLIAWHATVGSHITVHTDAKYVCLGLFPRQAKGDNADLWQNLWDLLEERKISLKVKWVKSHAMETPVWFDQLRLTLQALMGNSCADVLAARGSDLDEVDSKIADKVINLIERVQLVQKRIVAILRYCVVHHPNQFDRVKNHMLPIEKNAINVVRVEVATCPCLC